MSTISLNNTTKADLASLIDTRLLVQANSGGGKSWCIRRILEQSHGKVQQIVIDLEGEFATLREKYDYILAGKGGDIPTNIQSAPLLAKRLLELNVSAIVDLYELPHYERKIFVKRFLEAMIDAPKELWHSCLVVVDEAHVFCPEKGQSEAMSAVIELCTRGRKRGYSAVLATQRLSKLHKDAAAECNNKLIGRTGLDVDMKRAAEELGFTSREQYLSLRALEAGEFFAFGPAISTEVTRVKIGGVETTHPKAGSRILASQPTAPTEKIKSILQRLTDLPKEAAEEAKTVQELKAQIVQLRRQLTMQVRPVVAAPSEEQIKRAVAVALNKQQAFFDQELKKWAGSQNRMELFIKKFIAEGSKLLELPSQRIFIPSKPELLENLKPGAFIPCQVVEPQLGEPDPFGEPDPSNGEGKITGGAMRMLQVLARRYPVKFTRSQLASLAILSPRSGTYGTYLSLLKTTGCIVQEGDLFAITQKGIEIAGDPPKDPQDTVSMWRNNLNGGARRMFDALIERYPDRMSKEELAAAADLSVISGTFGTYMSKLRGNGLIEGNGEGIKASENLFV